MPVKILQAGESPEPVADVAAAQPASAVKATAAPTPSETVVKAAPSRKSVTIDLSSGRKITVRRLGPLDRMIAAKAIGSELVVNALYANYALVACSVTAIDGDPVAMPGSNGQIEALIYRLGDDFDELTEEMKFAFGSPDDAPFDPAAVKN